MLPTPVVPNLDIDHVYEPAEDTFLFLDLFEDLHSNNYFKSPSLFSNKCPLVLEIGSGSGVISTFISSNKIIPKAFHLASDINIIALKTTLSTLKSNNPSSLPFDTIRTNLTDSLKDNQIDLLIFNPPYVPSEDIPAIPNIDDNENSHWLDLALVGGHNGMLITDILLDNLNNALSINGQAYILFCARNNHPQVVSKFLEVNTKFTVDCVIQRKCGWEELAIYRFTKNS